MISVQHNCQWLRQIRQALEDAVDSETVSFQQEKQLWGLEPSTLREEKLEEQLVTGVDLTLDLSAIKPARQTENGAQYDGDIKLVKALVLQEINRKEERAHRKREAAHQKRMLSVRRKGSNAVTRVVFDQLCVLSRGKKKNRP